MKFLTVCFVLLLFAVIAALVSIVASYFFNMDSDPTPEWEEPNDS